MQLAPNVLIPIVMTSDVYSQHCAPYIFYGDHEENLSNDQDFC